MKPDLNLFGRRKDNSKGSSLLLFISIISALIGGISGCSCGEDVVDGIDAIIVDGGTEDIVDVRDAISFVFEEFNHPNCVKDEIYYEDRAELIRTQEQLSDLNALSILAHKGRIWVGTETGLFVRNTGEKDFTEVNLPKSPVSVRNLFPLPEGGVLAACDNYIMEIDNEMTADIIAVAENDLQTVMICGNDLYALAGKDLTILEGEVLKNIDFPHGQVLAVACFKNEIWIGAATGLWQFSGTIWKNIVNSEESSSIITLRAGKDFILAGSENALFTIDEGGINGEWHVGLNSLPAAGIKKVALSRDESLIAAGHAIGVTLINTADSTIEHFHSLRWLPHEQVNDIAFAEDGSLWAATPEGLARLYKVEMTLKQKAEMMFDQLNKWFWRMDGFITASARFEDPWTGEESFLWDDDNDGQWTEEGVAAFCYAYAVTGEEKYYEAASRAVKNMLMLIDVPAVSFENAGLGRGFVARSLVRDDEGEVFNSKKTESNWHHVSYTDGHEYYWKDDTSSDETTGHFFGLPLYYDLCAKDKKEKEWVAEHIVALASYILDNGLKLIDLDGEQTTHGYWNPEKLAIAVDGLDSCIEKGYKITDCIDAWGGSGYLNAIEILGALLAAWHVSGDERFYKSYEELITVYRYDELVTFNKDIMTWTNRHFANYCDHELADLAYLTLIRYDPNEDRRRIWLKSILDAWEYEKGERNPLKALSMAAFLSDSPGLEQGIKTLREYPSDLREFLVDNSHRMDVELDVDDRMGEPQFKTVLPYDEIAVMRWDHNPYRVKRGGNSKSRMSPAFWLLPYWGLRYYKAICE